MQVLQCKINQSQLLQLINNYTIPRIHVDAAISSYVNKQESEKKRTFYLFICQHYPGIALLFLLLIVENNYRGFVLGQKWHRLKYDLDSAHIITIKYLINTLSTLSVYHHLTFSIIRVSALHQQLYLRTLRQLVFSANAFIEIIKLLLQQHVHFFLTTHIIPRIYAHKNIYFLNKYNCNRS